MTEFKFYREDGTIEDVTQEEWCWVANYQDGSHLKQFDEETGRFHQFKEIQQDKLFTFAMVYPAPVETPPVIIMWGPGRKLIHFYRNFHFDVGGNEKHVKLYCFGYETKDDKTIFVIMPDGGVVITDNVDNIVVKP